jgi:hypothetical protein
VKFKDQMQTETKLLSTKNLEDGFVDVDVERLDGTREEVRLRGPGWRRRRTLILEFQKTLEVFVFVNECLSKDRPFLNSAETEKFLDKLTPDSVAILENYAVALCLGEEYQKKMAAAGREICGR